MNDLEDCVAEGLWDEGVRATGADFAEDAAAILSNSDILPLQTGYGGAVGCSLKIIRLSRRYVVTIDSEVDRVYLHPGKGVSNWIQFPWGILDGATKLCDAGEVPLLSVRPSVTRFGEGVD